MKQQLLVIIVFFFISSVSSCNAQFDDDHKNYITTCVPNLLGTDSNKQILRNFIEAKDTLLIFKSSYCEFNSLDSQNTIESIRNYLEIDTSPKSNKVVINSRKSLVFCFYAINISDTTYLRDIQRKYYYAVLPYLNTISKNKFNVLYKDLGLIKKGVIIDQIKLPSLILYPIISREYIGDKESLEKISIDMIINLFPEEFW
jgi:hypothetical protein